MTYPFRRNRARELARDMRRDAETTRSLAGLTTEDYDGRTEAFTDVMTMVNRARTPDWTAPPAAGASLPAGPDTQPFTAGDVREIGHRAWDQRPAAALPGPRDTGPMQRLPRIARTAARPRPQRPADAAIFVWVPSTGQHVLLCSMCLWRRHCDPVTATLPFTFDALRDSAAAAGWRTDAFDGWCCPACQDTPAYWSPRPLAHAHPEIRRRKLAGHDVTRSAEATAAAIREHDLILDTAAATSCGRHRLTLAGAS